MFAAASFAQVIAHGVFHSLHLIVWSSSALAAEIPLAVVGFKVRADGQVAIEGQESAGLAIEPCDDAVGPRHFENISARGAITQDLSLPQIFLSTDRAELGAVLFVVIQKFLPGRKANVRMNADRH